MALNAYQTTLNNALKKQPVFKNPLLELAQQGATTGATPTTTTPTTGAANTGNLTAAQIQSLREDAQRSAATAQAVSNAKTTAERNEILRQSAQQAAVKAGVPGSAQAMAATKTATPTPPVTQQPPPQQTAFQAYMESAAPQQQYLWRNMGENEMHTMNAGEQRLWQNAMQGYANGDYSAFNDNFQKAGNWGSYVDANGKVSGMLRYAGDGVGGYIPVNEGKVMQGMDPRNDYVFYGPGGEAYTMDANGNLFKTGTWTDDYDPFPKNGYYYNNPDRMFIGKDGQAYTYADVPEDKLAEWGFVRRNDGIFYEPETVARNKALANGEVTLEQLAMQDFLERGGTLPGRNTPGNNTPSGSYSGGSYSGGSSSGSVTTTPTQGQPTQPTPSYQPVQTQPTQTPYQAAVEEWSYGPAPEWNGTDYERQRDEALASAGEKWQGSEYQQRRDDALKRAEDMQWNYDPNTDPVWQALQKQYRREGDRATQEALAQAAMRTGGLANSYAVTAASQAGDYYAAQLSDRLPQLYQDAYQRYLQEFQRQMGISDQYQGFDDREYSRWADQQGRNFDLADRYNQYGNTEYQRYMDQLGQYNTDRNFDYGRYRDRIGDARYADETAYDRQRDAIGDQRYDQEWAQKMRAYADEQNWKATEWQQYLREYGDKMSQQEREWAYQQYRDAVGDQQYADQQAQNERKYADALAQQDWENSLTEDKYNRSIEDTARSQAEERAMRYAVLGNYGPLAELWGMTEDEVAAYINGQQGGPGGGGTGGSTGGGSGSGNGSGGGYSGGGYSGGGGNAYGGGDVTKGGVYDVNGQPMTTVSGIIHDTNHEPMTSGFREWWPTLRDAFDAGASSQELAQAVDTLYRNGIIAEYEIDVILDKLGLDSTNSLTQKVQNKIYDIKQAAKRAKSGESAIDNLTSRIKSKIAEAKSKNGG